MTEPPADPERHLDNLRAVYRTLQTPPDRPAAASPQPEGHAGRNTLLGAIGLALVFVATKLKFLGFLAGVLKLKTLATMALSIGVYATQWGLPYAAGFVLLIFVHELGHAIVMRREGIAAGPPVFIPFVGAFIAMKNLPRNAYVEAKVALGGPVLGSLGAWAVLAYGLLRREPMMIALGHTGALLNLFNLIPVSPLDGGRIAGAFTRSFWIAGYAIGIAALVVTRSPMLLLVLAVGLVTLVQRWRRPVPGYDRITAGQRLAIGLAYAALLAGLGLSLGIGAERVPRP